MKTESVIIYIVFLVGLIATLMLFFPALSYEDGVYSGLNIAFGKELVDLDFFGLGSVASAKLPLNIFAIGAYLLPLIGGILILLNKKLSLVSAALFIIAFVIMLTLPNQVEISYTIAGSSSTASVDWSMGYGLIIALILNGIGALLSFVHLIK